MPAFLRIFRFVALAAVGLTPLIGTAPAFADFENADQHVQEIFAISYKDICTSLEPGDMLDPTPEKWDFTFSYDYEPDVKRPFRLYRFHCFNGAYNAIHVFYGADQYEEVHQIFFAEPSFDLKYENDDFDSPNYKATVNGFTAYDQLVNSEVDPDTQTIYEYSKWRGMGDASSEGAWTLDGGRFVLQYYDIDASYDGEHTLRRIYGDGKPRQLQ
ncbi:MAG: DUF1176 domain-containing protein [Hyphomicrobiaceae bacterium]|nr:DUF1176 domain-containing protein [Hyphomicrobiaceae bacterium]MCC0023573.1 DUF1176 domain-containing protein [Hyphomicrobiaceae bacterium]